MKVRRTVFAFLFTLVLIACGGGSLYSNTISQLGQRLHSYDPTVNGTNKNNIRVTVSPPGPITLASGAKQQFTAQVTGTGNKTVIWSVTAGTISAAGLFTAPTVTTATTVALVACSVANPSSCDQVQILVNPPSSAGFPTATLSASPSCYVTSGSATLSWSATNATNVSITPNVGPVAANGTFTVSPTATTTFTLTASNSAGSVVATAVVTVDVPMLLHAYDPVTGVEQLPAGGPFTVVAGSQLQFAATGGCTGN